jgi:hypothetical protein
MHDCFVLARHRTVHILRGSYRTDRKFRHFTFDRKFDQLPNTTNTMPSLTETAPTMISDSPSSIHLGHFGVFSSFECCSQ